MSQLKIYKASAGSGKTFTLARKYLVYLLQQNLNLPHRHILAVTFTNKATAEMKSRIIKELHLLAIQSEHSDHLDFLCKTFRKTPDEIAKKSRLLLQNLLQDYSAFQVSTIDRFFLKIIRNFTREMSLNGNYTVELNTENVLNEAIETMLNNLETPENKQLLQWLKTFTEELVDNEKSWNPSTAIKDLGKELFKEIFKNQNQSLGTKEDLRNLQNALRTVKATFENEVENIVENLSSELQKCGLSSEDFSYGDKGFMGNSLNIVAKDYEINPRLTEAIDYPKKWYTQKSPKKSVIEAAFSTLNPILHTLVDYINAEIPRYNTACEILKNIYTLGILSDLQSEIEHLTQKEHLLLLANATDFLSKIIENTTTPFIYEKIGTQLRHIMIDEFQDTSTVQWRNFRPLLHESLSSGHENLIVGDVKQSIYRWRNSDWDLLNSQLEENPENAEISRFIDNETLDTNFRSHENIIDFNNDFFVKAVDEIKQKFEENKEEGAAFSKKIEQAYSSVSQQHGREHDYKGFVQIELFEKDEENTNQAILTRMLETIEELLARGNSLSDIAVLVRKNAQAVIVAESLLKAGYRVLSNEALQVRKAQSVQFIIALLRVLANPKDTPNKLILLQRYYEMNDEENPLKQALENIDCNLCELMFEENPLPQGSLFEQTEAFIQHFHLAEKYENEVAFIQALQDAIFEFEQRKGADSSKFLTWWDEQNEQRPLTLNVPQSTDAINIFTIHKSKGLEFKNVIVPFANWEFKPMINSRIWCATQGKGEPFEQLPIVPMRYNKKMENSLFYREYLREKMKNYIDTLNLAYVAFTRAERELYIFSEQPKGKTFTLANVLWNYCSPHFEDEKYVYSLGRTQKIVEKQDDKKDNIESISLCYATTKRKQPTLKHRTDPTWISNTENRNVNLNYGLLMHDLLAHVQRRDDIESSIRTFVNDGKITEAEGTTLKQKIDHFIDIHLLGEWFLDKYHVVNETEILRPNQTPLRPDRVMIDGKHAIVVDYKFGQQKSFKYCEQVKEYQRLLQQMGYTTEGYLCYIELDEVERVES